ncbi:WD40 repeat domain-containing protein [Microcoleus sp. T3_B1]|uniref:WD40 domain-containing protein n=1 Tax=Microcoleus sp. T3_B1 TaxID=3055425 RepID=UPI002FD1E978
MSTTIEQVKKQLSSPSEQERLAALSETLNYGQQGLELLIEQSIKDQSDRVKQFAYRVFRGDNSYLRANTPESLTPCPTDVITCLAISPDTTILVGGSWKKIWVWNLQTGEIIRSIEGHSHWVLSVAISPDGNTLVSGSADKNIKVWNLKTGQVIRTLNDHSSWITAVAIPADGKKIVSGSTDKTIKIWELNTGKLSKTIKNEKELSSVLSLCISHDGKVIACGSTNNKITLWNLDSGKLIRSIEGHSAWIQSLNITSDNTTLISGSRDGVVKFWQSKSGEESSNQSGSVLGKGLVDVAATVAGFSLGGPIAVGAWVLGRIIVAAADNGGVSVLPLQNLECTKTYPNNQSINSLACNINQNILVVGISREIKIFDLRYNYNKVIYTLPEQPDFISSVAVSPNGKTLAVAGKDWVTLLEPQTGKPLHAIKGCSYPKLSKIVIHEISQALTCGQVQYFTVQGLDQNNRDINLNDKDVEWETTGGKIKQGLFTAGQREGRFEVKAKIGIFETSVTITIIQPPRITEISVTPSRITLEFGKTQQFTAQVLDQRRNPMPETVLWEVSGGGEIDHNGNFIAESKQGKFEIIASVSSIRRIIPITIIEPPKLTELIIISSIPQLEFGQSFQFQVKGVDQYGDSIQTERITWSTSSGGGIIDQTGYFIAVNKQGNFEIIASVRSIRRVIPITIIEPPKLTELIITSSIPQLEFGQSFQFEVKGLDQYGNNIQTGKITWSGSSGGGTLDQNGNFVAGNNAKGKFRLTATATEYNISAFADIEVVSILRYLSIFPKEVALKPEQNFTFDAIGFDQQDEPIQINQVYWQCTQGGRINGNGTFIGGYEKREVTVTATVKGISQSVKVTLLPVLRRLEISPQKIVKLQPDECQKFTAIGIDQYGNRIDTGKISWETTGGKIDQSGNFTAASNAKGTFKVTANVTEISESGVRAKLLILGIYMRLLYRVFSFVNFTQNNFILKSAVELVKTNFTTGEQTEKAENIETDSTNEATDILGFDIDAWLHKNIFNIVARILDLAGQLFINAAKISASVEVVVVPVLRRLEIYPKEAQLKPNQNLTFSAKGFDQQGDLMMPGNIIWRATSGKINSDGKFIAGKSIGQVTITGNFGEICSSAFINIVEHQKLTLPRLTLLPNPVPTETVDRDDEQDDDNNDLDDNDLDDNDLDDDDLDNDDLDDDDLDNDDLDNDDLDDNTNRIHLNCVALEDYLADNDLADNTNDPWDSIDLEDNLNDDNSENNSVHGFNKNSIFYNGYSINEDEDLINEDEDLINEYEDTNYCSNRYKLTVKVAICGRKKRHQSREITDKDAVIEAIKEMSEEISQLNIAALPSEMSNLEQTNEIKKMSE